MHVCACLENLTLLVDPQKLACCVTLLRQVGQLTCAGLAHAYSQCAAAGIRTAPLLAALRKATRVKLTSMQPGDLTALLTALAAMGQQDLLYLDEIARCGHVCEADQLSILLIHLIAHINLFDKQGTLHTNFQHSCWHYQAASSTAGAV